MLKRIALLALSWLVVEPAFGDMPGDVNLQGVSVVQTDAPLDASAAASAPDCERRFRSLRARSQMRPSERERALEACLELARSRVIDQRLAASGGD